nr:restriction endonuclease subunit S [Treponema sp.]
AVVFKEVSDARYVKYCFDILQRECKAISVGAAQDNLSWDKLSRIQFPCPPLETQQKIAGILSAYEDLIENNRKQIKLLEEAAQKLYKEWFVKLNFPGHENVKIVDGVPETWKKTTIGELIEYEIGGGWGTDNKEGSSDIPSYVIRGTDIDDIKEGNFSNIPFRYQSNNTIKTRQLQTNDIIFEVSGGSKNFGVGRSLLFSEKIASRFNYSVLCASFCKLIRLKEITISNYVYDSLKYWRFTGALQPYERRSASNIVNFGWQDFLNMKDIIIPSEAILVKYLSITETFKEKIDTCTSQIQILQSARDKLLPKLMNGDIDV